LLKPRGNGGFCRSGKSSRRYARKASMDAPPPPAPGTPNPPHDAAHPPAPVDLAEESIAGEEDPGAALDEGIVPPAPSPAPVPKPR
jgi:hypothetical protein